MFPPEDPAHLPPRPGSPVRLEPGGHPRQAPTAQDRVTKLGIARRYADADTLQESVNGNH
jgi:hypothetical protein